jgi:hypothetical protein
MSDIGPKQGNLFSTAARRSGRTGEPTAERVAPAIGVEIAASAAEIPRVLHIGPIEKGAIKALIERAGQHPVPYAEMRRRAAELTRGIAPPSSLNREFTIKIPHGFTVTYTHEEQPVGSCRHLSIAVDRAGRAPHPVAVDWLMREFGFCATTVSEVPYRWFEALGNDRKAINLVEIMIALKPVEEENHDDRGDYIFDENELSQDNC